MKRFEVIVVGGGLAGLTAAIELAQNGKSVLLIEKNEYPTHKVCGEYVSNEVVPYLESLGIDLKDAVRIENLQISNKRGESISSRLPLGGIGISRFELDYRMYQRAVSIGVSFVIGTVNQIHFNGNEFHITISEKETFESDILIGAFGKRSNLDKYVKREFTKYYAPWIGVKAHYEYKGFPENLVAVHSFNGGYGGLSKTESGAVNFCYLANYSSFKKYGDIPVFNETIVAQNPHLNEFLANGKLLFTKPLAIAQVSFNRKTQVEDHILMCGDAAGLIHPLCGNGMAMAIHSALLASRLVLKFFADPHFDRSKLERSYTRQWQKTFSRRLWWGRQLQNFMLNDRISELMLRGLARSKWLTNTLISKTHGKPLELI